MTSQGARIVKQVLVNRYERTGDAMLRELEVAHGDRLCVKVRLADVLDVDRPGFCSKDEWSFALRSHLDFVFVDEETSEARFAVELDGAQHRNNPDTLRRDAMKDALCDRADLPLLRVANRHIGHPDRIPILRTIAETYYLAELFADGQEHGFVPMDEPYSVNAFPSYESIDRLARRSLWDAYREGRFPVWAPSHVSWRVPEERSVTVLAWMSVAHDRWIQAEVTVRDFSFNGILPDEFAEALAAIDLASQAARWLDGAPVGCNTKTMQRTWDRANQLEKEYSQPLSGVVLAGPPT